MTARGGALALVSCLLAATGAFADSFTPVRLGITIAHTAHRGRPLQVRVAISADAGALDAPAPLWLRVKLARECGGTWAGTPGTVLLNKRLKRPPATGRRYRATLTGSGRPSRLGVQSVCVWLEQQRDNRVFATSQAFTVRVLRRRPSRSGAGRAQSGIGRAADRAQSGIRRAADRGLPKIGHVFIIVDENESASTTFGPSSPAPYLSKTLTAQGAYLPRYYGTGHESNDNYIAMISGQAPNVYNQADCPTFANIFPGTIGRYGQAAGIGCVYPPAVETIANQLTSAGLTWGDYNDSMGADPAREASECAHPGIGQPDGTQTETATDQYATRHNPFVYFHSIIDDTIDCDEHVVNLEPLPHDLSRASLTPNYVFITPGLCDDGHDASCADGGPGGLARADDFLKEWVPRITSSPAFTQENGLLIITFDEAETGDGSSCCGEIAGPGSLLPGIVGLGGGDIGAVLVSPCIAPGTVSQTPYNHYTMLRSVEDLFGLPHLGYAQLPGETSFGSDVFTRARACSRVPAVRLHASIPRGGRVRLRWRPTRAAHASSYAVSVSRGGGRFRAIERATRRQSVVFRGRRGSTYRFRVRATGWNGTGAPSSVQVSIPRRAPQHARARHRRAT